MAKAQDQIVSELLSALRRAIDLAREDAEIRDETSIALLRQGLARISMHVDAIDAEIAKENQ